MLVFGNFVAESVNGNEILRWFGLLIPVWAGAFAGLIAGWSAYRLATPARSNRFKRFAVPAFFLNALTGGFLALVSGILTILVIIYIFRFPP